MQKLLLELGRSDKTAKRKGLVFLSSNTASNSNNKLYITFPTVLVEMESGEIEWFDYKFVLKKQPFICWAIVFNRSTTGSDENLKNSIDICQ